MTIYNPVSLNKLLPFVAIGTVADCQSVLQSTNRLLVRAGIARLQKSQGEFVGLSKLLQHSQISEKLNYAYKLSSQDLGFVLSPILNSSGRVSHANLSISVLVEENKDVADELAKELVATNQVRKQMVKDILVDIESQALSQYQDSQPLIWLQGDWSKGIVGLLASRLVNQYNLPVVVVSMEDGLCVASLRAPEGFHLPKAMEAAGELLLKFGGHPGAAGFSCALESLAGVEKVLKESIAEQRDNFVQNLASYLPPQIYEIAPAEIQRLSSQKQFLWVDWSELNQDVLSHVWNLDPFGQDFPFPEIAFKVSKKDINIRWISGQKHLKIVLSNGLTATAFNVSAETVSKISDTSLDSLWCVGKISQNTWQNKTTNDLIIHTIKVDL